MLTYSEDGYHWKDLDGPFLKPTIGNDSIMRDPSITRDKNGTYHLVWTTEWRGGNGFGYANSKDLVHWSTEKYIPVMEHEPEVVNVWAPELFYDDEADRFIIIWASTIPNRFEKGEEEEKNNHRMYYTTTKDFITFTETKLFLDPGFSVIDAVIVKRAKNDYVLVLKDNTRPMRNLKVAFANNPLGPYKNISEPFTDFLSEGPTVVFTNEEWLIYYDNYGAKNYKAVATQNFKEFRDVSDSIQLPKGHKHGTITTIDKSILQGVLEKEHK
ncbi:arabinosidase [Neptunitalea sp. Y10]|uniref:Arabinosidase n=2 Tax=Neptunitalea lumnitzerae TaxID=2965509 RepID=A0ABQ5MJP5_9FLAO|nr:arabinosidase [Neptunitalea sp. Y10]